jgi:hypothetical protein
MDTTTPHSPPWGPGRRGPTGDRTLQGKVRCRHEKDRNRLPRGLVQIGDAPATPETNPDSPSTPGTRVLERSTSVLGGYHPSRIPTRTIRDRLQIGTKTALTSTEWISGLRIARRGAQAGGGPSATGPCSRRSGGGLQNAEIAFLGDWYKLETPWPLDRPSQTHLGASARAPADCRTWGFGKGVVSSDFPVEVGHCARRALP